MSADGIGAYFSPDTLRPIQTAKPLYQTPVDRRKPVEGIGAYYSPASVLPVEQAPLQVSGFGETPTGSKTAAIGLLFLLVFGVWLLKRAR